MSLSRKPEQPVQSCYGVSGKLGVTGQIKRLNWLKKGRKTTGETSQRMNSHDLALLATAALEDLKGRDIVEIDIAEKSNIADAMVVATGTSKRHVKSLADQVRVKAKDAGEAPLGVEGEDTGEWVLVDLGDVIVHVMTEEMREFYALEKLWSVNAAEESQRNVASPASPSMQL